MVADVIYGLSLSIDGSKIPPDIKVYSPLGPSFCKSFESVGVAVIYLIPQTTTIFDTFDVSFTTIPLILIDTLRPFTDVSVYDALLRSYGSDGFAGSYPSMSNTKTSRPPMLSLSEPLL